jgi:ferredoxin-like protein FixX
MRDISTRQRCMRCGRQAPDDSADFRYGEFLACDADGIICPRCREEQWKIPSGVRTDSRFSQIRPEW